MTERPTLTSTTIASQIRDPRVRAPVTLFVPPQPKAPTPAHSRPRARLRTRATTTKTPFLPPTRCTFPNKPSRTRPLGGGAAPWS